MTATNDSRLFISEMRAAYCACVRDARIAQENWAYAHNPAAATPEAKIRHSQQLSLIKASCSKYGPAYGPDQFPTQTNNQSPAIASQPCVYDVDPRRIEDILRARPGVCQRYGRDRIICQADTSQPPAASQSAGSETWDHKIERELESAIESRATAPGFDHKKTEIEITISYNARGGYWNPSGEPKNPYSTSYWQQAQKVVQEFYDHHRLDPPDNRPRIGRNKLVISLGGLQPSGGSQRGGAACPTSPGQTVTAQNAPLQTGIDSTQIRGGISEEIVVWQTWCEEYRRVLKQFLFSPLQAEFSGDNILYRVNSQIGFYNPKFNNAQSLSRKINQQQSMRGATVRTPGGIIVVLARPGFTYSTAPDAQPRVQAFKSRFNQLAGELANKIPAFPEPSRISYFGRRLTIDLNDPNVDASETGARYGKCEDFLNELESSPSTERK